MEPRVEDICIEDIAHALSNICRFGGHSKIFYSVAQHAVHVSHIVPPHLAYHGLHHDSQEALLGSDIVRPLKQNMPEYKRVEAQMERVVWEALGISNLNKVHHDLLKWADNVALLTEKRDLTTYTEWPWGLAEIDYPPTPERIRPLSPIEAEKLFLDRHFELKKIKT
jgi:5'-deoxynucleotidase YfbR-like HD superfamily hydrolase